MPFIEEILTEAASRGHDAGYLRGFANGTK
jgi:hypothetical protein